MSLEREALKERLEMERMEYEHRRKMRYSWGDRNGFMLLAVLVFGFFGFIMLAAWLSTNGVEGVREWLSLLGCGC